MKQTVVERRGLLRAAAADQLGPALVQRGRGVWRWVPPGNPHPSAWGTGLEFIWGWLAFLSNSSASLGFLEVERVGVGDSAGFQ